MKKIFYLILLIFLISCKNSGKEKDVIWITKSPINVFNLFSIDNKMMCWNDDSYFEISIDGKIKDYGNDKEKIKYLNKKGIEINSLENDPIVFWSRGADNYLYVAANISSNDGYDIQKYDKYFKKIGIKHIKSIKANIDFSLCIYADKDGYIYVTNEFLKTITKFSPLKDGEDATVDLKDYKVTD
jgi:hypothetical protein